MDWSTILTIAAWIFFVVMMVRGGGCCGMGSHHPKPMPGEAEARDKGNPTANSNPQHDQHPGTR